MEINMEAGVVDKEKGNGGFDLEGGQRV